MRLLNAASLLFRARRSRPRVVMLVKGAVRHDSRVRKSAASLRDAGAEVLVLGAVQTAAEASSGWELEDDIAVRVVRLPDSRAVRRHRRDAQRAAGKRQPGASARGARKRADPLDLARYDAAWWPLVRRLRPDVVHVHDMFGLAVARRARRRGARSIYDAHEHPLKLASYKDGVEEAIRRQVVEYALHADAVITVGEPLSDVLVSELGLPHVSAVVHNAPLLRGAAEPAPGLRETVGVDAHHPLLVYAGVLTPHRRLDVVLEAMTTLPEVRLALLVDPLDPLVRKLGDRARQLAVSERVHQLPMVAPESVVSFVAEADVGLFPLARYPGGDIALPNKLFEYLHAGLPMVVSDSPTMADFVRRHGLGEVAPVDDARAWAQAIERALAPPRYRDRVSEWEALKEEWCWERQEEALVAVYRKLLGPAFAPVEDAA